MLLQPLKNLSNFVAKRAKWSTQQLIKSSGVGESWLRIFFGAWRFECRVDSFLQAHSQVKRLDGFAISKVRAFI
jgi:hypothetical protein